MKEKSGSDLNIQLTLSRGFGTLLVAGAGLLTAIKSGLSCSLVHCRHPWSLEERNHFRLISTKTGAGENEDILNTSFKARDCLAVHTH